MPRFVSSDSFLIYNQIVWNRSSCSTTDRKPPDRVLVVERPWRNDGDERKGGTSEADVDGKLDILQEVADEEGDGLFGVLAAWARIAKTMWLTYADNG